MSLNNVHEQYAELQAKVKSLQATIDELEDALKQAALNFNRNTKYGKGWHDALAYVNQAALKEKTDE